MGHAALDAKLEFGTAFDVAEQTFTVADGPETHGRFWRHPAR
jgi:hypothetical protein